YGDIRDVAAMVDDVRVAVWVWLTVGCGSLDDAHLALELPAVCRVAWGAVPGRAFVVAPVDLREGVSGGVGLGGASAGRADHREPDAVGLGVDVHPRYRRARPLLERRGFHLPGRAVVARASDRGSDGRPRTLRRVEKRASGRNANRRHLCSFSRGTGTG